MNDMSHFSTNLFTNDAIGGSSLPNLLGESYMDITCTGVQGPAFLPSPPQSVMPTERLDGTLDTRITGEPRTKGGEHQLEEEDDVDDDDDDDGDEKEEREVEARPPKDVANRPSLPSDQRGSPEAWMNEHSNSSRGNGNRKSTMVLKNMKPDLVSQVLRLLFSSESTVDVKIFSQD